MRKRSTYAKAYVKVDEAMELLEEARKILRELTPDRAYMADLDTAIAAVNKVRYP